jgi:hypothetical protein
MSMAALRAGHVRAERSSVFAQDSNAPILPRMLRNCGVSPSLAIHPMLGAAEHEAVAAVLRLAEQSRKPSLRTDFQQTQLAAKSGQDYE